MATRIFGVEYWITELYNGKDASTFKEDTNVVAKDALEAILKVKAKNEKKVFNSYVDSENKNRRVTVTRKDFEPIRAMLQAEAD